MTFQEAVDYLDSLQRRKWREGLGRMRSLVEVLGLSEFVWGGSRPRYIHVAGTNGKGSVCAYLQSILAEMGTKAGTAASPYVYDVRERVQIGRDLIPHEDFSRLVEKLAQTDDLLDKTDFGPASAFEMKTALAFLCWQESEVSAAALEVGLGGRLDATNVVVPAASLIVSIGWDHMEILGDTLAKIAAEKAGIIKPMAPAVVGELPLEALEAVREAADRAGTELWQYGQELQVKTDESLLKVVCPKGEWAGLIPGMRGKSQGHNAALALAGLAAAGFSPTEEEARRGVANASWPGRFERTSFQGKPLILDGAHNITAGQNLADSLLAEYPDRKIGAAIGMLRSHQATPFVKEIQRAAHEIRLIPSPSARGRSALDLAKEVGIGLPSASVREALESLTAEGCEALVVTGSFYILAEAKACADRPDSR
jgi:dihydrofolate synthase / folylpolyglutamate synthase